MPVDLTARRSVLSLRSWNIELLLKLLESLMDTYDADEEEEQRELLKQMRETISKLEKGGNNYGPFIKS